MALPKILRTDEDVDEMARYTKEILKKAHEAGQEGISIVQQTTDISLKPRYALAFIYEEIPAYDRVDCDGNSYRYYKGGVEMAKVWLTHPQIHPLTHLEVFVTEAESEKEAIAMLLAQHPYHIVSVIARQI